MAGKVEGAAGKRHVVGLSAGQKIEFVQIAAANGVRQGSVDLQKLVNGDPTAIAGEIAVGAAGSAHELHLRQGYVGSSFEPRDLMRIRRCGVRTVLADSAHESLGHDAVHRCRNHVALRPDVQQAMHSRDGAHRMQCREHQMARDGRTQSDIHRLAVSHLTDQDDVGILSQRGTQHSREVQTNLGVHLDLIDPIQPVFHRILDGDDFRVRSIEML